MRLEERVTAAASAPATAAQTAATLKGGMDGAGAPLLHQAPTQDNGPGGSTPERPVTVPGGWGAAEEGVFRMKPPYTAVAKTAKRHQRHFSDMTVRLGPNALRWKAHPDPKGSYRLRRLVAAMGSGG